MFVPYPAAFAKISSQEDAILMCPFRNSNSTQCSASIMKIAMSKRQTAAYCCTENFDSCPVFLGKVLRGTRIKPLT